MKFFRDQKNSWLMKGILILTALSFVSLFRTRGFINEFPAQNKPVITIADRKITMHDFVKEFRNKAEAVRRTSRRPFSVQDAVEAGMLEPVLREMLSRAVMEETANELNLAVSDETVRETMRNMPAFMDYDGSFSYSAFKNHLSERAMTEQEYVDAMFIEMRAAQLLNAAQSATVVPDEIVEMTYRIQGEKRVADTFFISPKEMKVAGKPSQADMERLYKELSEELIAPEYRTITVMAITPEAVSKQIQISEEELQEIYNENRDSYTTEEIRDVDQMLFTSQEEAEEAYAALEKGMDFMDAAKKMAKQTAEQTKLGDMTPSTATGEWADIVFSMKKGEYSQPVQTAFGWQILRVNKITPKVERNFKEAKKELEQKVIAATVYDKLQELSVTLDDRLGAGERLEDVAASAGLPVKTYTMIDSSGVDENGKTANISKAALSTAFVSEAGRESPMIEEGASYYVVRVDDIRDPVLKTMDKSKPEIMAAWTEERQKEEAKKTAKNVEERLKKGENARSVAKMKGVTYKRFDGLSRRNQDLPASVTYMLFSKKTGEPVSAAAQNGYVVARAVKVIPADPEKDAIGMAELRRQMKEIAAAEKADVVINDYSRFLGMQIYQDAIQNTFAFLSQKPQEQEDDY